MINQLNGNQILVGKPTDLSYGLTPSNYNLPNITPTDKLPDALDKIANIFDKLAPIKSPELYTKKLSLIGDFYSASHVSGNVIWVGSSTQSATASNKYEYIYFGNNPVVKVADSSDPNSDFATFSDGQSGYLQADIDFDVIVQKTLDTDYYPQGSTASPDIGTWGDVLTITYDSDPYSQPPQSGFWTSLKATMSGSQSFVSGTEYDGQEHTYVVSHLNTGSTPTFRFICDNGNATPPISLASDPVFDVITQSNTRYVSGIPSLEVGDWVSASYSVNNTISGGSYPLISRFYNTDGITALQVSATTIKLKYDCVNGVPVIGGTSSIPTPYQSVWSVSGLTLSIPSNMMDDDIFFSFRTYNPAGDESFVLPNYNISGYGAPTGSKIYIDTVSDESDRYRSGNGQYPSFGSGTYEFGDLYSPTYSALSIKGNIDSVGGELMLQNGKYQYPSGDYTSNYPISGDDYTSLISATNSYLTYRWATFNVGSITYKNSVIVNINDSNFTLYPEPNILMYVTVTSGLTQSIGWIDGNSAWLGGSPKSNGDGALVISESTATSRYITFGTYSRSGDVWVRIGIPSGSSKNFGNVTYQLT